MPMKKGSGSLDFTGGDDGDDSDSDETPEPPVENFDNTVADETEPVETETNDAADQQDRKFPYFVRRSKILDERDERIEVHLRDDVHEAEQAFRGELADSLDETGEISKTDAHEFALKYAFENPDGVAELMREEGYGLTD